MDVVVTKRLLSPDEVAEMLGIPRKTLFSWRTRGVGPRGIRVGKHVRYRASDVELWLDEQADRDGAAQ